MFKLCRWEYHCFNDEENCFTIFMLYIRRKWWSKHGASNGAAKGMEYSIAAGAKRRIFETFDNQWPQNNYKLNTNFLRLLLTNNVLPLVSTLSHTNSDHRLGYFCNVHCYHKTCTDNEILRNNTDLDSTAHRTWSNLYRVRLQLNLRVSESIWDNDLPHSTATHTSIISVTKFINIFTNGTSVDSLHTLRYPKFLQHVTLQTLTYKIRNATLLGRLVKLDSTVGRKMPNG